MATDPRFRTNISCPICGDADVKFSGMRAKIVIRSYVHWLAPYLCVNSHSFFLPFVDNTIQGTPENAASELALENLRKS